MGRRRRKLWEANPQCHWCGVLTVIDGRCNSRNPTRATLDHLRSRLDPKRGTDFDESTVLACWKCNNERARQEDQLTPVEEKRRRAQMHKRPKGMPRHEWLARATQNNP